MSAFFRAFLESAGHEPASMSNNLLENPLFDISPKVLAIKKVLSEFVEKECIPAEEMYHKQIKTDIDRWKV
jgi:hypothetical protein